MESSPETRTCKHEGKLTSFDSETPRTSQAVRSAETAVASDTQATAALWLRKVNAEAQAFTDTLHTASGVVEGKDEA